MSLCPKCENLVKEACDRFDDIPIRNFLVDIGTSRCRMRWCRLTARTQVKYRSRDTAQVKCAVDEWLGISGRIIEKGFVVEPTLADRFPLFLRNKAYWEEDLTRLQWLQRKLRSDVTVYELQPLAATQGITPGRARCFMYLEKWLIVQSGSERSLWRQRKPKEVKDFQRKFTAAAMIQRWWRRAMADPHYAMCRKRLMAEFVEM